MKNITNLVSYELVNISPKASLEEAAKVMRDTDCGILLVGENGKLQGVITDRDIVIRAVSTKKADNGIVENYMSKKVYYCKDTDSVLEVIKEMQKHKVGRLIVKRNSNGEICGVISLGDIVRNYAKLPDLLKKIEAEVSFSYKNTED